MYFLISLWTTFSFSKSAKYLLWVSQIPYKYCNRSIFCSIVFRFSRNIQNDRVDYYFPTYTADGSLDGYIRGSPFNGQVPYDARASIFCNKGYIKTYTIPARCDINGNFQPRKWSYELLPDPFCKGTYMSVFFIMSVTICLKWSWPLRWHHIMTKLFTGRQPIVVTWKATNWFKFCKRCETGNSIGLYSVSESTRKLRGKAPSFDVAKCGQFFANVCQKLHENNNIWTIP